MRAAAYRLVMARAEPLKMTRRAALKGGALACTAGNFLQSHAAAAAPGDPGDYQIDSAATGSRSRRMHGGKGMLGVKFFFEPERPSKPALFLEYDIPPGASEGVHTHSADRPEGPWDEFYYIVSGSGRMTIGETTVEVKTGDNVHTPLGVSHGIENTSQDSRLHVYLVAILRE